MAVEFFRTFSDYDRQAAEARKRRRMADLLAQQVVEPTDYGRAPIPAAAPLVRGLQAFLAARAAKKAGEAEEGVKATEARTGEQIAGRLTGGAPVRDIAPPDGSGLDEVAVTSQYKASPEDAFRLALSPAGAAATRGNPMLAAMLARSMEKPKQLEVGAIDPSKFTPESVAEAQRTGNIGLLKPRDEGKAPTVAGGMMWDAQKGKFVPIEGYVEQQGQIAASKRPDVIVTSGRGGMGKPPAGYRYTAEGDLEAIPGGPADPSRERVMPGSITQNIVEERARGRKFADISSRADEFISAIESGQLPLSPVSSAKYQAQRLLDSSRGVQPSEKEPYVRFFDLQRFVNEQVNAILNLAKGPQTEGDALRARQQILDNPNNEKVVVSALKNLQRIYNKEAELSEQTAADYERQYGRGAAPTAPAAPSSLPPGFRKVK